MVTCVPCMRGRKAIGLALGGQATRGVLRVQGFRNASANMHTVGGNQGTHQEIGIPKDQFLKPIDRPFPGRSPQARS